MMRFTCFTKENGTGDDSAWNACLYFHLSVLLMVGLALSGLGSGFWSVMGGQFGIGHFKISMAYFPGDYDGFLHANVFDLNQNLNWRDIWDMGRFKV